LADCRKFILNELALLITEEGGTINLDKLGDKAADNNGMFCLIWL
jgi:hypothetical protein